MFEHIEPTVFASGFQSPEGPSFDRHGVLHFVDWDAQIVYQVTADGIVRPFVNTGGVPTGSKFHRNGHLFVADGDRGILDISPQGAIRVAASDWQGQRFRDPKGSDPEHPIGNVFILRRDGRVDRFAGGYQFPNGIALSDDGHTLYLAETFRNHILAFELDKNGHERSRRVFARLDGGLGPDGMAFGLDGNLYVAHYGKGVIAVIDPQGEVIAELPAGGMEPTNVAFWESNLYVTEVAKGQVVRLDVGIAGQVLYGLCGTNSDL